MQLSNSRLRRLNRRKRKKLHVGEFRQLCIRIHATLAEPGGQSAYRLLSELHDQLESRALQARLSVEAGELAGAVFAQGTQPDRPDAADRQALVQWFARRHDVASSHVGVPEDAWYPGS